MQESNDFESFKDLDTIMLAPRLSISYVEGNAKAYIRQMLEEKGAVLEFTRQTPPGCSIKRSVITLGVLDFMVKIVKAKHEVYQMGLSYCEMSDQMLKKFSKVALADLQILNLFGNDLTVISLGYLKKGTWKRLRQLDIGRNNFGKFNGKLLLDAIPESIQKLGLSMMSITSQMMSDLSANNWTKLIQMDLSCNDLRNEGLMSLIKSKWPKLQTLDLSNNKITNDGCKVLSRGYWKQLKTLTLGDNFIDQKGFLILSNNMWRHLKEINIRKRSVSRKEINYTLEELEAREIERSMLKYNCQGVKLYLPYPQSMAQHDPVQEMVSKGKGLQAL